MTLTVGPVTLSGMALSAISGVILHLILPDKEVSYGDEVAIDVELTPETVTMNKQEKLVNA